MKLLKKLLIILIVIIAVVAVSTIGVYVFVRTKYDIDLFSTVKELKILTEDVDENKLCPNIIKDEDFPNMKNTVNRAVRGLVKDNVEEGYKGYYLDYKGLTLNIQKKTLVLDEQNLAALLYVGFYQNTGGKISLGGTELDLAILQTDISFDKDKNPNETNLNIVAKLDISPLKKQMNSTLNKLFGKKIPDYLYISSNVLITKTDLTFGYVYVENGMSVNNLNIDETTDLINTLNKLFKIGTSKEINTEIAKVVTTALIGDIDNPGLAFSLKLVGATSFNFDKVDNKDCFLVRSVASILE